MTAMIGRQAIVGSQIGAQACRNCFLADGDMQRAGNFASLMRRQSGFLECADAQHCCVEIGQATGVAARSC